MVDITLLIYFYSINMSISYTYDYVSMMNLSGQNLRNNHLIYKLKK